MVAAPIEKTRNIGAAKKVAVQTSTGSDRQITLDPLYFSLTPNVPLMHQVVNAQLAARRAGTQSTKTRAEVSGGGSKPYRQKGTGRARQGSTRAPQFSGGGIALGPKPRSYAQKTPKKMIALALRSALSDRANEEKVIVTSGFDFTPPKTKEAATALANWGVSDRESALLVLGDDDENIYLAFRNLLNVHVLHEGELNAYDVLRHDYVVFTEETVPGEQPDKAAVASPKRKASEPKSTDTADSTPAATNETAPETEA
jgi:large subunit ribosomal protein L4